MLGCAKPSQDIDWPKPSDPTPVDNHSFKNAIEASTEECKAFIDSLPTDYLRGFVDVPEDWSNPKSPTIHIFFYGHNLRGKTPIVFFNGGPTSDSHSSFRAFLDARSAAPIWRSAPLVFIDQRGTGCSSLYPEGENDETLNRLKNYGSSSIVRDAEAIRKVLIGQKPWKVYGQSFGAWIAHRYVTLAPSSVTRVFAHANALTNNPIERLSHRIAAQDRVLQVYFRQYPDDRRRFEILHTQLTSDFCLSNSSQTTRRCGLSVIEPLINRFGFVPKWPWMHEWLTTLVEFDPINEPSSKPRPGHINVVAAKNFLDKLVFSQSEEKRKRNFWASQVIDRYDRDIPSLDRPMCDKIFSELRKQKEHPENYLLHECMVHLQLAMDEAKARDREIRLRRFEEQNGNDHLSIKDVQAGLAKLTQHAFSLYSGSLDIFVPIENFEFELQTLGSLINYKNFTSSGHDGFYTEAEVAEDVVLSN